MRRGRQALVYDLMEPLRPKVDRAIIQLLSSRPLTWGDVWLTDRGVCRLHPQSARVVAGIAVPDDEVEQLVGAYAEALPLVAVTQSRD